MAGINAIRTCTRCCSAEMNENTMRYLKYADHSWKLSTKWTIISCSGCKKRSFIWPNKDAFHRKNLFIFSILVIIWNVIISYEKSACWECNKTAIININKHEMANHITFNSPLVWQVKTFDHKNTSGLISAPLNEDQMGNGHPFVDFN